jgi:hypothetical protein
VTRRLFCLALSSILFLPIALAAHEGHDHKIMGTVVSIDAKKIVVKPADVKDGAEKTAAIDALTTFHKGKAKGMASDVKVGSKVVLNIGAGKEPLKAKDIQYAAAPATASAKK